MSDDLTRDQLVEGLGALVRALVARGEQAGIYIVGGAAIALVHFERRTTSDVDVRIRPDASRVMAAAGEIAVERGWAPEWLNDAAAGFIPDYGKQFMWIDLVQSSGVHVSVAPAETLLVMKVRAGRIGRDDDDIAQLMAVCEADTYDKVEALYAAYYPGEVPPDRGRAIVEAVVLAGLPPKPLPVSAPRHDRS